MTFEIKKKEKTYVIWGSLGQKSSVLWAQWLAWKFLSTLCGSVEQLLLSLGNTPTMHHNTPTIAKAWGREQGQLFPSIARDFNQNTLDVTFHLCFFIISKQKAAPGTAFTKDSASRQGCVGTAVNPRHVSSMRNTRHKAYWIKELPGWSLW